MINLDNCVEINWYQSGRTVRNRSKVIAIGARSILAVFCSKSVTFILMAVCQFLSGCDDLLRMLKLYVRTIQGFDLDDGRPVVQKL